MTQEQMSTRLIEIEKKVTANYESTKSAHKRIDENDRTTDGIHKIASNVEALATQIKYLTATLDTNVARLDASLKNQGERIGALEKAPGDKWKALTAQIISLIVAALIGGFFARM